MSTDHYQRSGGGGSRDLGNPKPREEEGAADSQNYYEAAYIVSFE